MDVKQLRYFICIAEAGSLSGAAQQVNVAQPSLSQHVLSLERELGVKLLERSSRGVTLTQIWRGPAPSCPRYYWLPA